MQDTARILISLPKTFLEKVDDFAKKEEFSRSELVRQSLRSYIRAVEVQEAAL